MKAGKLDYRDLQWDHIVLKCFQDKINLFAETKPEKEKGLPLRKQQRVTLFSQEKENEEKLLFHWNWIQMVLE